MPHSRKDGVKKEFDLHGVEVDPGILEVPVVDRHLSLLDFEIEGRFGGRQVLDLLLAVFLVDDLGCIPLLDLLYLRGNRGKALASTLDRVVPILGGEFLGPRDVSLVEGDVRSQVIVLEFFVDGLPVDFFEKSNAFFHAVLEKVVIGSGQNVVRIRGRLVLEDLEQAMILLVKPVVHDFPFLAQLMSSCIDGGSYSSCSYQRRSTGSTFSKGLRRNFPQLFAKDDLVRNSRMRGSSLWYTA